MIKEHTTATGNVLYVEIGRLGVPGAWAVYGDINGLRLEIGRGVAPDAAAAEMRARERCQQFDAEVASTLEFVESANDVPTVEELQARFAALDLIRGELTEREDDV